MTKQRQDVPEEAPGSEDERVVVEDGAGRRPFMRGIMVHSLIARGVDVEVALATADEVQTRVVGRGIVGRSELAKLLREILGDEALQEHQPPLPPLAGRILVTSARQPSVPFSKGTLSQSLLAASIDPNDAFDVAARIEQSLLLEARDEIPRGELRGLSYEALLRRFGPKTAERFLIWRRHQEPEKPVIILLGGTTGSGKTSLALEVAQRLGISRVASTDSIRQILRITLTPDLVPALHASSFEAHPATFPIDGDTQDPVLAGFHAQAAVVSVGIRAMIDRAIDENASLILDGVSLVPGLIDLSVYRDVAHVIFLVVARLDEEAFRSHFISREERQRRRGAQRYVENLDAILKIQEEFLELADRSDVPIVDNVTIDGSVLLVIRHVVESLRREGGYDLSDLS
ncbi:MAG: zeta toxin family protein [Myxococcota bacterium]|nr:zeta toxin family protein [Myxococcota bacterium]